MVRRNIYLETICKEIRYAIIASDLTPKKMLDQIVHIHIHHEDPIFGKAVHKLKIYTIIHWNVKAQCTIKSSSCGRLFGGLQPLWEPFSLPIGPQAAFQNIQQVKTCGK